VDLSPAVAFTIFPTSASWMTWALADNRRHTSWRLASSSGSGMYKRLTKRRRAASSSSWGRLVAPGGGGGVWMGTDIVMG
jgi:hypothetical protein